MCPPKAVISPESTGGIQVNDLHTGPFRYTTSAIDNFAHGLRPACLCPVTCGGGLAFNPAEIVPGPRVRRWTCSCVPVTYELVQAGGVFFIRRTRREADGAVVEESRRWITSMADTRWRDLLSGRLK